MDKVSCAIMFADVSGSTKMYDELGDEVAKGIMDKCLGHLQGVIESHQGIVIKKIGDELMCRFETALAAISAAREAQSEIKLLKLDGGIRLTIRAGIHFGEVIEDDNDIFGDAVNIAARMAGIAKGGQILTTEDTVECLPPEKRTSGVRQVDITKVKGKQEKIAVYEVMWEQNSTMTRVATTLLYRSVTKPKKLELRLGSKLVELDNEHETIAIGRDDDCDLIVNNELASRKHVICELRRGKFLITDHGTNGTYVTSPTGEEVYLRREELVLQGNGSISLGKPISQANSAELIHFKC